MAIEITIPRLGWNMEEGVFVQWHKRDGDAIKPGDVLFSFEGDKAVQEIESIDAGILRIPGPGPRAGETLKVGALIGYLVGPGESAPAAKGAIPLAAPAAGEVESPASPSVRRLARELGVDLGRLAGTGEKGRITADDVRREISPAPAHAPAQATIAEVPANEIPCISPRARRVAREMNVEWKALIGTGGNGRIRERDILAAAALRPASRRGASAAPAEGTEVPLTPLRRVIATRMAESAQTTAPVTLTTTVDASNLVNLRNQFRAVGGPPESVPSYTDFLVKLTAVALDQFPQLNQQWAGGKIWAPAGVHIGVAVDTPAGLLVPVLRNVSAIGIRELAGQSRVLFERARERKLSVEELSGGTFTVTNLGAFEIDAFTPIINVPQTAILGIGRIVKQPAVVGDQIVVRETLTLSLTFDHRAVDGAPAARMLQSLKRLVENPGPWLMV